MVSMNRSLFISSIVQPDVIEQTLIAVVDRTVRRSAPDLLRNHFRQQLKLMLPFTQFHVRLLKLACSFGDSDSRADRAILAAPPRFFS